LDNPSDPRLLLHNISLRTEASRVQKVDMSASLTSLRTEASRVQKVDMSASFELDQTQTGAVELRLRDNDQPDGGRAGRNAAP